jgi:DNA-binding NarL/FixJ family response regulator
MTGAIRVAIVDDHPVARWGMESLLGTCSGVEVVVSTGSADDVSDAEPDVVILDLYLYGRGPSLDAVTKLSGRFRVLVISASGRRADVLTAIRSGADGYLNKRADEQSFVDAVHSVAAGEFYLSSELADIVEADLGAQAPGPATNRLSPREEQVLHYIAAGFTHAQTATRMGLRTETVNTYVKRIRAKIGLGNKADLTRIALELDQLAAGPPT